MSSVINISRWIVNGNKLNLYEIKYHTIDANLYCIYKITRWITKSYTQSTYKDTHGIKAHMHKHIHTQTHTHTCIHIHNTQTHTYTHKHMHTYTHKHTWSTHTHRNTHMYANSDRRAQTHGQTLSAIWEGGVTQRGHQPPPQERERERERERVNQLIS